MFCLHGLFVGDSGEIRSGGRASGGAMMTDEKAAELTRRTTLGGLIAGPAAAMPIVRAGESLAQPRSAHAGAIDMHCHIFNGDDLPIQGFLKHAVFEAEKDGLFRAPKAIVAFLGRVLGRGAPSARDELDRLQAEVGGLGAPEAGDGPRDALSLGLTDAILELQRGAAGEKMDTGGAVPAPTQFEAQELLNSLEELVPSEDFQGAPPSGEAGRRGRAIEISEGLLLEHEVYKNQTIVLPTFLSSRLAILRAIDFASIVLDWRAKNVDTYAEMFGGPDGVALMTPSLVDFDHWVGSTAAPDSPLAVQVEVMSALARRESSILVHGFAAFDPLRDALNGKTDSFDLVRDAIEAQGLLGVKIYPPMGFFPAENGAKQPPIEKEIRTVTDPNGRKRVMPNDALNRDLDKALNRLYEWAADPARQVPILAHARDSYGARDTYALRARPSGWASAFAQHSGLSVAMAHFGDFHNANDGDVWEMDLPALFAQANGAFGDLSYMAAAMDIEDPKVIAKKRLLLRQTFPSNLRDRLLFGTDWLFISLARGNDEFITGMDDHLEKAGFSFAERRAVFRDNALRFLGLQRGRPGAARLERFYVDHGLDRARLDPIFGPK